MTNGETGEAWVEVVGGRAGDRAVRSFRPDQLYAPVGPPRPRPVAGRRPRASARLTRRDPHGPPRHPHPDHGAARAAAVRARGPRRARRRSTPRSPSGGTRCGPAMTAEETAPVPHPMLGRYETDGFGIEALIDRARGNDDRVGRPGRAPLPARDPPGRRGGVAPGGPLPRAGPGHGGRCRRARVRVHRRRPRVASSASTSPRTSRRGRVMDRLGFTHCLTTTGPRGEEVAVMELTRERWEERRAHG